MTRFVLTPSARNDLREIWSYIASDNLDAADRVENAIYAACAQLAKTLALGHVRRDLTSLPVLFWTVVRHPSYVIVYDPAALEPKA